MPQSDEMVATIGNGMGSTVDEGHAIVEMAESVHESRGREIRVVASLNLQTIPPDGLVNGEVVLLVLRWRALVEVARTAFVRDLGTVATEPSQSSEGR